MSSEHIERRKRAEGVAERDELVRTIEEAALDQTDRKILRMRYLEKKSFGYIADETGYCTRQIVRRHKAALIKMAAILEKRK